jgi:ATP-dependent RNA helicase DOB1
MITTAQSGYVVDVLLACAVQGPGHKDASGSLDSLRPASGSDETIQVVPVLLSTVDAISHLRIHLPKDLRSAPSRDTAWKAVKEIQRRWPKSIPLLDPVENMGIKDTSFLNLVNVRFVRRALMFF